MRTLIYNIKTIVGASESNAFRKGTLLKELPLFNDAYILIEDDKILEYGSMQQVPTQVAHSIDAKGGFVLPSFCDSHTHLVFAQTREAEFVDKIRGASYEEIAKKGGGILNSAKKLQNASEDELFEAAWKRLKEIQKYGTGAIEIKSGYGLTLEAELKMLRVIRRIKEATTMPVKATLLAAHALPLEYKENRTAFIDLVVNEMIPQVAQEGLADYIDVFCEKVAFTVEETQRIMETAAKYGLKPKVHTNQFNCMGGIQACVAANAVSVDHLEVVNDEEIACLLNAQTIPTLLPSAPFFLNDHYPPARKMIDAGLGVALASDYNPGSTPSGKIPFVLSLACIKMKMTPEEAINAATINGACAMEIQDIAGTITAGKLANLIITTPMETVAYMPYAFGSNWIQSVLLSGKVL
jgi:imidazolonepropionase